MDVYNFVNYLLLLLSNHVHYKHEDEVKVLDFGYTLLTNHAKALIMK